MIRNQSTRLAGRQPHRDVLRGAAHFSTADNQRCCGYGQGVSRSDWAISTINIIDRRLVRAHDAAREDHIVLSLSLHSSLLVYSLLPLSRHSTMLRAPRLRQTWTDSSPACSAKRSYSTRVRCLALTKLYTCRSSRLVGASPQFASSGSGASCWLSPRG